MLLWGSAFSAGATPLFSAVDQAPNAVMPDALAAQVHVTSPKGNKVSGEQAIRVEYTGADAADIPLYEVKAAGWENIRLNYGALLKVENAEKGVQIQMLCHFPGKKTFFSRQPAPAMMGASNWTSLVAPFFLKKGEAPEAVSLGLRFGGPGAAWISGVKLTQEPLPEGGLFWEVGLGILGAAFGVLAGGWANAGITNATTDGDALTAQTTHLSAFEAVEVPAIGPTPGIEPSPAYDFNFGIALAGTSLTKIVTVSNIGSGVLSGQATLSDPSGVFSIAGANHYRLATGANTPITLAFAPRGRLTIRLPSPSTEAKNR
jgi:hypothetical protein